MDKGRDTTVSRLPTAATTRLSVTPLASPSDQTARDRRNAAHDPSERCPRSVVSAARDGQESADQIRPSPAFLPSFLLTESGNLRVGWSSDNEVCPAQDEVAAKAKGSGGGFK